MHPVTLQYRDEVYEKEYCNKLLLTTQHIIERNMKALIILDFLSWIYFACYQQWFECLSCTIFGILFLSIWGSVQKSFYLYEILATILEIIILSVSPCFAFLAQRYGLELNAITIEFASYLGGQVVYFFCQPLFIAQRFKSKGFVIVYSVLVSVAQKIYQKNTVGILEVAVILTGIQSLHSIYKNEQILREAFISKSREEFLSNSLDDTMEISFIQYKHNPHYKRLELLKASKYSLQQIGVNDQDTFLQFLRNSEVVTKQNKMETKSQTRRIFSVKTTYNLEQLLYSGISQMKSQNHQDINQIIHNKKLFRVKTFTFIQNNLQVHHIILERLEENQTILMLKAADVHNRNLIEFILETYPKYLIPALMLLRKKFEKDQNNQVVKKILVKIYKPIFRFMNIQIYIKNRDFQFRLFDLSCMLQNVKKMSEFLSNKVQVRFITQQQRMELFSSRTFLYLILMNVIRLAKIKTIKMQKLQVMIQVKTIKSSFVPIIQFRIDITNKQNQDYDQTDCINESVEPKASTFLDEQIILLGIIKRIVKLIGPSDILKHTQHPGIETVEFQIYQYMQTIPVNEFRSNDPRY